MNPIDWTNNKEMQVKRDKANQQFNDLRLTKYLNDEAFYEAQDLDDRWLRLDESI